MKVEIQILWALLEEYNGQSRFVPHLCCFNGVDGVASCCAQMHVGKSANACAGQPFPVGRENQIQRKRQQIDQEKMEKPKNTAGTPTVRCEKRDTMFCHTWTQNPCHSATLLAECLQITTSTSLDNGVQLTHCSAFIQQQHSSQLYALCCIAVVAATIMQQQTTLTTPFK